MLEIGIRQRDELEMDSEVGVFLCKNGDPKLHLTQREEVMGDEIRG